MEISVIIPSYKPGNYLWECLNSLELQTLSKDKFEIILILNGCNEPYRTEIDLYIKKSKLHYNLIQTDTAGVSNARNLGIERATGEYITFIDDDDFVSPSFLNELLDKATPNTIPLAYPFAFWENNPVQISYKMTDIFNKYHLHGPRPFSSNVRQYFNGAWMKLIHRNIIKDNRFNTKYKIGEDALFMFLISNNFKIVDFTSTKATYYRRYRNNSAVTSKKNRQFLFQNSLCLICSYSKIYFRHPLQYSFVFYLKRILATFKALYLGLK